MLSKPSDGVARWSLLVGILSITLNNISAIIGNGLAKRIVAGERRILTSSSPPADRAPESRMPLPAIPQAIDTEAPVWRAAASY